MMHKDTKPFSSIDIIDKLCSEKMDLKKTETGYRLLPDESNSVFYVLRNDDEKDSISKEE